MSKLKIEKTLVFIVGLVTGLFPLVKVGFFVPAYIWLIWIMVFIVCLIFLLKSIIYRRKKEEIGTQKRLFSLAFVLPFVFYFIFHRGSNAINDRRRYQKAKEVILLIEKYKNENQYYPKTLNVLNDTSLTKDIFYSCDNKRNYFELYYYKSAPYTVMYYHSNGIWQETDLE